MDALSLSADLTSCASVTRLSASLRPLVLLAKEPRDYIARQGRNLVNPHIYVEACTATKR